MSGWPSDWVDRTRGKDCPMCASVGQVATSYSIFLWNGEASEARLERRSAVTGYCTVVWRDGHVAEPTELGPRAAVAYWQDVIEVGRAIQQAFSPVKVNYMLLGNLVPHLHTHVVPRYTNDPAPGGPLSWDALTKVQPSLEHVLQSQAAALRLAAGRT